MIKETLTFNASGLNVFIDSGIHGNESSAVNSLYWAYYKIKDPTYKAPDWIKSITFCIGVNEAGLAADQREWVDYRSNSDDLNRMFPPSFISKEDIKNLISNEVAKADVIIDVHNSEVCKPCALIDNDINAVYLSYVMRKTFITPMIRDGNSLAGTIKSYVNNNFPNKIGITVELPGMGFNKNTLPEDDVVLILDLLENLDIPLVSRKEFNQKLYSGALGMRTPNIQEHLPVELTPPTSGLIKDLDYSKVTTFDPIKGFYKKGDIICKVLDLDSGIEFPIYAPFDGYLFDLQGTYYAVKGRSIGSFARNIQRAWITIENEMSK